MKPNIVRTLALTVLAGLAIALAACGDDASDSAATPDGNSEKTVDYWVAPMDPSFRSDTPGKSPMGMDLIPVYKTGAGGEDDTAVRISPSTANNIGIRTAKVTRTTLGRRIETVGFVAWDDTRVSHIHTRAEGWIDKLVTQSEGERVKKGDLLFRIYSPDLVVAQSEYVQILGLGQKALIKLAEERLELLKFTDAQIKELRRSREVRQRVDIYADRDGVIVNLNVAQNMYVTPGATILTIADLSDVWVMADVFEEQAQWMKVGLLASVHTPFQPDIIRQGVVEYVYPTIDPVTRTLKVRMKFENANEALKPNMYAEVSIAGEPQQGVLSIPRDALIRTGSSSRVILALEGGRFEPRDVETGIFSDDRIEIISGLAEGDAIVVSGQFLIDSEASLSASLRRMSDPADAEGMHQEIGEGIPARGTINSVMAGHRMLNVTHAPIPAIGWPTMTMDFTVSIDVDLSHVKPGDDIHFELIKNDDDEWIIQSIHVMSQ